MKKLSIALGVLVVGGLVALAVLWQDTPGRATPAAQAVPAPAASTPVVPAAPAGPATPATPVTPAAAATPAAPAVPDKPVAVEKVAATEVAALIVAGEETTLSSQMAGKIRRIGVGLGDQTEKGARLIEFDCSEQAAQLDSAKAEYLAARETHLARLRLQALGAAGELEVTVAAASADKAKSQVSLRQSQLAYCHVEAPFRGNVARLRVKPAESVNLGQPLIDLVNPASLKAQMFVPAAWIAWLKPGTPFTLNVRETGQTFSAKVSKVNSRVDGVSQQLELEARIEKGSGQLLPGMVGSAVFEPPRKQ
jgi:membrane fusion protein, multidrug efflux system